jgi:hypothetical protein
MGNSSRSVGITNIEATIKELLLSRLKVLLLEFKHVSVGKLKLSYEGGKYFTLTQNIFSRQDFSLRKNNILTLVFRIDGKPNISNCKLRSVTLLGSKEILPQKTPSIIAILRQIFVNKGLQVNDPLS